MDDSVGNGLENPAENRGLLWRAIGISLIGYAADYYDFGLYATVAALVFPRLFFPNSDPTTALLASFGTFTAGFVTRPLGGVIFGQLGDRIGRKKVFVFGMVVIGLVTTAICLLPTFATIGILAPTLLVLLRMVQGIAVGGQFGAAALVTTEYAPNDKRGFYSSLAQIGAPLSDVLVNLSFLALTVALTQDQFLGWGWLVPAYTFPKDREDLAVLRVVVRNGFSRDLADLLLEELSRVLTRLERQSEPLHNATSAAYHHNAYRRSPSAKEGK